MGEALLYEQALEANRAGRLDDEQRREIEAGLRARHSGLTGLVSMRVDTRSRDLKAGVVESVEGAITKRTMTRASGESEPGTIYMLELANRQDGVRRYRCIGELYELVPQNAFVRLYYLPRSRWAVNVERVDAPVPEATDENFRETIGRLGSARQSHDRVGQREAAAEMQAMADEASGVLDTAPPASDEPLERALLGSWRSSLMRLGVTFAADGTLTAELPDGERHEGRWSLQGEVLHAEVPGSPIDAEARISGERLILSVDGQSLAFERAG